jgi:16S rRNA (cytosine967-C5)-methyltransferase
LCDPVDKILVDAPCSGLGVLSKRVDLRWKRTLQQIDELVALQRKLLTNAASRLKIGGVLVYCTCTIEPEENEQIIDWFLAENRQFKIDRASQFVPGEVVDSRGFIYTYPQRHRIDGSFSVRLIKA